MDTLRSARDATPTIARRAVCPGSFDPVTNGHLDIIGRASNLYDEVVVAVLVNQSKSSMFTVDERIELLRTVTARYENVRIDSFRGLLVDYCRVHDIPVIVKGLRAVSDFDYELQMAQMNRGLAGVDTMFMPTNPEYSFLASSLVKDVARWGGDVSALVPPEVLVLLKERTPAPPTDDAGTTDSTGNTEDTEDIEDIEDIDGDGNA